MPRRKRQLPVPGPRGITATSIADWLRLKILDGKLAPGSRLATRSELERTLGASSVTIQRAINRLRENGFLESRSTSGTFVTHRPPHLFRVGLVLPPAPSRQFASSLFWRALELEGARLGRRKHGFDLVTYRDIEATKPETTAQLLHDITHGGLAGVILVHVRPEDFAGTPLMTQTRLARISTGSTAMSDVSTIIFDECQEAAVGEIRQLGATRAAMLMLGMSARREAHERVRRWQRAAAGAGVTVAADQCIELGPDSIGAARKISTLLLRQSASHRPQGLIIADDHFIEPATLGILDAKPPTPPAVVGHANYPVLPPAAVPITRVGYDISRMLEIAVEDLERQISGDRAPKIHHLAPRVER